MTTIDNKSVENYNLAELKSQIKIQFEEINKNKNQNEQNTNDVTKLNDDIKIIKDNLKNLQLELANYKDKLLPDLSKQITNDFTAEKDKAIAELDNQIKIQSEEIEKNKNQNEQNSNDINKLNNEIKTIEDNLQKLQNETDNKIKNELADAEKIKNQLAELDNNYQKKYTDIENNANQLNEFEAKSLELKNEISQYHDKIFTGDDSFKVKLDNLYNDYIKKSQEINKLNSEIFVTTPQKTDEIITKEEYENLPASDRKQYKIENDQYIKYETRISIKEKINSINKEFALTFEKFKTEANDSLIENREKNENLRNELKNMIEELVSGATTAGLAKSHEKAKKDHSDEMKHWRLIFYLSLVGISLVFLVISLIFKFEFSLMGYVERLLLLAPIILPLIWIATVANKNIHQNKRLYEEYLHKWAIAFSFDGLKKEIEKLDKTEDKEYIKKLLDEYLIATALNPSSTLEKIQHTDSPFDKLSELVKDIAQIKEILNTNK